MRVFYFDDEQPIEPQALNMLHKVLADVLSGAADYATAEEELEIARELISLFKAGFRAEEELRAMTSRMPFLDV